MLKFRAPVVIVSLFALALLGPLFAAADSLEAVGPAASYRLLEGRSGEMVSIRTAGGGDFTGRLFALAADRVEIVNGEGQIMQIAADEIKSVQLIAGDQAAFFQDAADNRLLVMPTAFEMEPGEFHIAVTEIIVVTASYGVSPNFSIWGGISIPGALMNARFSVPLGERAALSAGSFVGLSWFDFFGIAMPYVITSIGTPNENVTVGVAAPIFVDSDAIDIGGVVVALAGKIILSRTSAIVTENWIILGSDGGKWDGTPVFIVPAVVFRIAGSRFSWDVGATLPMVLDHENSYDGTGPIRLNGIIGDFVPLPLISFTYRIR